MDFEQWKPLTGRGDPLRNDPTYDYEPPILERVHYWAEETRLEREHNPERKSEVLMLGVSSRKPSVTSRQPPLPPRRHVHRPQPNKYEDFTYKLSDHYPMTILVPPPPPPPGHQPPLFILSDEAPINNKAQAPIKQNKSPENVIQDSTTAPEHLSSFYALQESNLIYQSSTTTQDWIRDSNETKILENAVSSDYAGWGPTTPVDDNDAANDTHNLIFNDHVEFSRHPYSFYKPMLSESPPPPPKAILNSPVVPTLTPTILPSTTAIPATVAFTQVTWPTEPTTEILEVTTESPQETTEKITTKVFQPTPIPTTTIKLETSIFDMLGPMMSMPMVNGPERPEDNLYSHASETVNIFNENKPKDPQIETMQTMQPPPPVKLTESLAAPHKQQFHVNSQISNKKTAFYTHGPYLHNRFTTPIPTTIEEYSENVKQTTETPTMPMYLIIQGHSKVKTYGSKPKVPDSKETANNEISKPLETNEVKHLHPIIKKSAKKMDLSDAVRNNKAKNLKSLVDSGLGSIEIQETDVGIKYDVSDGSDVPIEIYRKGIVDNDENNYSSPRKNAKDLRRKRQIELEDLLPFDEEDVEEYVYNFLEGRKNETGITGLIAQAVTSDAAQAVDELEDDDESEQEEER